MKERKHYQAPWRALIPGKLYREVIQDKPAGVTEETFFYLGGPLKGGCIRVLLGENEEWIQRSATNARTTVGTTFSTSK